jgi:hypothetical protein
MEILVAHSMSAAVPERSFLLCQLKGFGMPVQSNQCANGACLIRANFIVSVLAQEQELFDRHVCLDLHQLVIRDCQNSFSNDCDAPFFGNPQAVELRGMTHPRAIEPKR